MNKINRKLQQNLNKHHNRLLLEVRTSTRTTSTRTTIMEFMTFRKVVVSRCEKVLHFKWKALKVWHWHFQ